MAIERYPDNDSCRRALRRDGFRQITGPEDSQGEFWHNEKTHECAEVARSQVFTYDPHMNAYREIAGRVAAHKQSLGKTP